MTGKEEIYRCNICGNIVEVLHDGNGKLECCENPMLLLEEKEEGMGAEKHVPILEETDDVVKGSPFAVKEFAFKPFNDYVLVE